MSIALAVAAILTAVVPTLVALAALLRWVYGRGEASGADKAKILDLERRIEETQAQVASIVAATQPKRRRT